MESNRLDRDIAARLRIHNAKEENSVTTATTKIPAANNATYVAGGHTALHPCGYKGRYDQNCMDARGYPTHPKDKAAAMQYVGIDPGKTGAICILADDGQLNITSMPETLPELADCFKYMDLTRDNGGYSIVIEKVHTSPQMGVVSAGTFMQNKGALLMGLACYQLPYIEVTPRKWQAALGVQPKPKTASQTWHKTQLWGLARQLYPKAKILKHQADAVLLAEYARLLDKGNVK